MRRAPLQPHRLQFHRRGILLAAATSLVALPVAACTSRDDSRPDPLIKLVAAARSDAATARAVAAHFPAASGVTEVAKARDTQAETMQREIDRVAGGAETTTTTAAPPPPRVPTGQQAAIKQLSQSLSDAQHKATELVPSLPSYRAGLTGSVAAGCASLVEVLSL